MFPVRHTVDFRAMQKVQRDSAISDVFEVQGLRRNRRKGRMPKFSFSHARKFQFPGRVPGPVAGAGLAGMILATCGPPAGGGNLAGIGLVLADGPHRPRSCPRRFKANASQGASGAVLAGFTGVYNARLSRAPTSAFMSVHWTFVARGKNLATRPLALKSSTCLRLRPG